jgi:precorrin-4 methylase
VAAIKKAQIVLCTPHAREQFTVYLQGKEWIEFPGMQWKRLYQLEKAARLVQIHNIISLRREAKEKIKKAAAEGKIAAVLLPGDPSFFSPATWFVKNIPEEHIEIIPGISALNAASAALKRSLLAGSETESVIITAPEAVGGLVPYELVNQRLDTIEELARLKTNLVFFMALFQLGSLIARLRSQYPPQTPAAAVYMAGYRDREKIITGTLADIEKKIDEEKEQVLGLFLVGPFLNLDNKSLWEQVQERMNKDVF